MIVKVLTDSDVEKICNLYTQGLSLENIVKKTGVWDRPVKEALIKGKIQLRKPKRLTLEQEREIVRLYIEEKLSTWDIGPKFNVLNVCIMKVLKRNGIILRNRSDAAKMYSVDRNYFNHVDTKEKAYILGLMYSDGNVWKDSFTLCLKYNDKYILELIASELKSTGPLNFRKGGKNTNNTNRSDAWILRIHDKDFVSTIKKLGIVERKTSKLQFPYWLNKKLWAAFILGLLDGDGSVSIYKNNLKVNIAGAKNMTNDIKNIAISELQIPSRLYFPSNSNGTVVNFDSSPRSLKFLNWLYSNPPKFFFRRKFEIYKKSLEHILQSKYSKKDTLALATIAKNIVNNINYVT